MKSHFRDSKVQNFPGGACPRTSIDGLAPSAFASPPTKNEGLATPLLSMNPLCNHFRILTIVRLCFSNVFGRLFRLIIVSLLSLWRENHRWQLLNSKGLTRGSYLEDYLSQIVVVLLFLVLEFRVILRDYGF